MEAKTKRIAAWITVLFSLLVAGTCSADSPQMVLQFGLERGLRCATMSPNGAYMATAEGRGAVLWDAKTGVILAYLTPPQAQLKPSQVRRLRPFGIYSAVFSPDSRLLALGDAANEISIWNTRTATLVRTLHVPGTQWHVDSLQFDPTGKQLMANAGFGANPVVMFSLQTGKQLSQWYPTLLGLRAWTMSAVMSADGQRIMTINVLFAPATSGHDPDVRATALQMHDAKTGKIIWQTPLQPEFLSWSASFILRDTEILLVENKSVTICRASNGKTLTTWPLKYGMVHLSISPDGKVAAITGYEGGGLYSLPHGHLVKTIREENQSLLYAPNGKWIIAFNYKNFQILAAQTLHPIRTMQWFERPMVDAIAASPDGKTYAIVVQPSRGLFHPTACLLLLFDAKTGMLRRQISLPKTFDASLVFSANSQKIACQTLGGWSLLDVATGDLVAKTNLSDPDPSVPEWLRPAPLWTGPVQFSTDGKFLLDSESRTSIVFRSPVTGAVLKTFTLPPGVRGDHYALSPDGQTLAITARNGDDNHTSFDVELWDVAQQKRIKILSPNIHTTEESTYSPLQFSPDGKTLVIGDFGTHVPSSFRPVEGTLDVYSMSDGIKRVTIPDFGQQQVAFSPDSKTLYTASGAAWDVQTGHALWRTTPPHDLHSNLLAAAVNASGQGSVLTSASWDLNGDLEYPPTFDDREGVTIRDAKTGRKKVDIYLLPLKESASGVKAQWLIVTADGYYSGSPGVSRWVRWRKGMTMLPAGALTAQRNKPELVQKALKTRG